MKVTNQRVPFSFSVFRGDLSSRILDILRACRWNSVDACTATSAAILLLFYRRLCQTGENKPTDRLERLSHRDGIRIAYEDFPFSRTYAIFFSPFFFPVFSSLVAEYFEKDWNIFRRIHRTCSKRRKLCRSINYRPKLFSNRYTGRVRLPIISSEVSEGTASKFDIESIRRNTSQIYVSQLQTIIPVQLSVNFGTNLEYLSNRLLSTISRRFSRNITTW